MEFKMKLKPICAAMVCLFGGNAAWAEGGALATEDISIMGQGQIRQVQSISSVDMKSEAAGTSALKVLEKLPGVHFTSSDPWGNYEWSTRFSVRGFAQTQLGFTLDGVPLGDMSYGNNNGLHISRAISSENIRSAAISQGAGALGTASTSNLGGTVEFFSSDPKEKFAAELDQTLGSNSTSRTFVRLDSGRSEGGTSGYISFTDMTARKWKGWGNQDQQQINSKIVHLFGENRLSAFFNASDRKEVDYVDMSIQGQQQLGWGWDNYAPNFQAAVNAANGIYLPQVALIANTPQNGPMDAAYYLGRGLRKDNLGGISGDFKLSDNARLAATIYHHDNKGEGQWYTPYVPTSVGNPISIRTSEYSINRNGVTSDLNYELDKHSLKAGVWMETNTHDLARRYYAATTGADQNYILDPTSPLYLPVQSAAAGFVQHFVTKTTQFHVQDTMEVNDKTKVSFGFKSENVTIDATSLVGTRAAGQLVAKKGFLPQAGVNYKLNDTDEVFLSYTENMRAYQPGVNGLFSSNQANFNASKLIIQPELSTDIDLGWRMKHEDLQVSLTGYLVNFKNRQVNLASTGIAGLPGQFANVGRVQTMGVEATAVWNVVKHVSWLNSLTLNDSKYQDNIVSGATLIATSGKSVVDAPKIMFASEATYEQDGYFGKLGMKYTDKRFVTYTNDSSVPAFVLWNLGAGYKAKEMGGIKDFNLQLNVSNLFNKKYFSTVGSNGFIANDPNGTFMTMLEGAPRQLFVSVGGSL